MKTRAIKMPDYMSDLTKLALVKLGLDQIRTADDVVTCPIFYEDGTEVVFAILHVTVQRWFTEERMALVSFCEVDETGKPTAIHFRDLMAAPSGDHDLHFLIGIGAKVRSMAHAVAATAGHGACLSL